MRFTYLAANSRKANARLLQDTYLRYSRGALACREQIRQSSEFNDSGEHASDN